MDQARQEDAVLTNIKCDYVRKNHKKLLHKCSPGRHPRSAYLKIYHRLMLPVVELKKLPESCHLNLDACRSLVTKAEPSAPIKKQKPGPSNIAKDMAIYDFDGGLSDSCEDDSCDPVQRQYSPKRRSILNSRQNGEKRASTEAVNKQKTHVKDQLTSQRRSDRNSKTNQFKRNSYAVIYKFLKSHKYLQSRLLSAYKGSNSRIAPFKLVINASSTDCKVKKIIMAPNSRGPSKSLVLNTENGTKTMLSDPLVSTTRVTSRQSLVDCTSSKIPSEADRETATRTGCKKELNATVKCVRDFEALPDGDHDGTASGEEAQHLEESLGTDLDMEPKSTDIADRSSGLNKPDKKPFNFLGTSQKGSSTQPFKTETKSYSSCSNGQEGSEQMRFEKRRKSALEVIRDLFYEATCPVGKASATAKGDGSAQDVVDVEKVEERLFSSEVTKAKQRWLLQATEERQQCTDNLDDRDTIMDIMKELLKRVAHIKQPGSEVNYDEPVEGSELLQSGYSLQHRNVDCEMSCSSRSGKSNIDCFTVSDDCSVDHLTQMTGDALSAKPMASAFSPATVRSRVEAPLYSDVPLSTAREHLDQKSSGCPIAVEISYSSTACGTGTLVDELLLRICDDDGGILNSRPAASDDRQPESMTTDDDHSRSEEESMKPSVVATDDASDSDCGIEHECISSSERRYLPSHDKQTDSIESEGASEVCPDEVVLGCKCADEKSTEDKPSEAIIGGEESKESKSCDSVIREEETKETKSSESIIGDEKSKETKSSESITDDEESKETKSSESIILDEENKETKSPESIIRDEEKTETKSAQSVVSDEENLKNKSTESIIGGEESTENKSSQSIIGDEESMETKYSESIVRDEENTENKSFESIIRDEEKPDTKSQLVVLDDESITNKSSEPICLERTTRLLSDHFTSANEHIGIAKEERQGFDQEHVHLPCNTNPIDEVKPSEHSELFPFVSPSPGCGKNETCENTVCLKLGHATEESAMARSAGNGGEHSDVYSKASPSRDICLEINPSIRLCSQDSTKNDTAQNSGTTELCSGSCEQDENTREKPTDYISDEQSNGVMCRDLDEDIKHDACLEGCDANSSKELPSAVDSDCGTSCLKLESENNASVANQENTATFKRTLASEEILIYSVTADAASDEGNLQQAALKHHHSSDECEAAPGKAGEHSEHNTEALFDDKNELPKHNESPQKESSFMSITADERKASSEEGGSANVPAISDLASECESIDSKDLQCCDNNAQECKSEKLGGSIDDTHRECSSLPKTRCEALQSTSLGSTSHNEETTSVESVAYSTVSGTLGTELGSEGKPAGSAELPRPRTESEELNREVPAFGGLGASDSKSLAVTNGAPCADDAVIKSTLRELDHSSRGGEECTSSALDASTELHSDEPVRHDGVTDSQTTSDIPQLREKEVPGSVASTKETLPDASEFRGSDKGGTIQTATEASDASISAELVKSPVGDILSSESASNPVSKNTKSSEEDGMVTEEVTLETKSSNPLPPDFVHNTDDEQLDIASNDELQVDLTETQDGDEDDSLPDVGPMINDCSQKEKEKPTVKRKKRKFKFTRKKTRTTNKPPPDLNDAPKKKRDKGRSARSRVEDDNALREVERGKKRNSSTDKQPAKRRKLYPRRNNVFYPPDTECDPVTDDRSKNKRKRKRKTEKNEETLMDSDDRLSVEFSKHNWFYQKYKISLENAECEHNDEAGEKTSIEANKEKRRRKQTSETENKKERNTTGNKTKSRKKKVAEENTSTNVPSPETVSNLTEHKENDETVSTEPAKDEMSPVDKTELNTSKGSLDENDTTDIKILEVVSLADYVEKTPPSGFIPQNAESDQPVNMAMTKDSISTETGRKTSSPQPRELSESSNSDELKPLDLRLKPIAESPLDLSLKPHRRRSEDGAENEKVSSSNVVGSSYACFNIPKPPSPERNALSFQSREPATQHQSSHPLHQALSDSASATTASFVPKPLVGNAKRVELSGRSVNGEPKYMPPFQPSPSQSSQNPSCQIVLEPVAQKPVTVAVPNETVARTVTTHQGRIEPGSNGKPGVHPDGLMTTDTSNSSVLKCLNVNLVDHIPASNPGNAVPVTIPASVAPAQPAPAVGILTQQNCPIITKTLEPPMELPTIRQESDSPVVIVDFIPGKPSTLPSTGSSLPTKQSGLLTSKARLAQSVMAQAGPMLKPSSNKACSGLGMPHTSKSLSYNERHMIAQRFACPERSTLPVADQARTVMQPVYPSQGGDRRTGFAAETTTSQALQSNQAVPYTQTAQQPIPVKVSHVAVNESRLPPASASYPPNLPRPHDIHQQQQFPHQRHQFDQPYSANRPLTLQSKELNHSSSVGHVSYPRQSMSYRTLPVQHPAGSAAVNTLQFNKNYYISQPQVNPSTFLVMNCEMCGSRANFLCSNCERVAYCSQTCQLDAWKSHRNTCLKK